jgi:hypothetical protein
MERTIPTLFKIVLGAIAGSAFIAQVFWEFSLQWVIVWSFSGIVFPVIGYVIAEMIINHSVDESRIYWLVGAITAIVFAIAGIVFKNLMAIP